jgi:hypothetical protein
MRKGVQEADEALLARSMDSKITEQAVAAMLADEALQLRRAAAFQGYSAFLQKPMVRARPNKQFLAATVQSVESGELCIPERQLSDVVKRASFCSPCYRPVMDKVANVEPEWWQV